MIRSLAEQLEYLQYISKYLPGAVYWKDRNGVYLGCNDYYFITHPDISREELIGKKDLEIWPSKAQAEALIKHDKYVMETGMPLEIEEQITCPNSTVTQYCKTVKIPLKDSNNNIVGIIGNSIDITEQKNSQKILQQFNIDLENAKNSLQAKSDFIVNISKDFKMPLYGIIGMVQSLLLQQHLPAQENLLNSVLDSAKLMLEFTGEILEIASIESNTIGLNFAEFNLSKLLDNVVALLKHEAKTKKIELISRYDPAAPQYVCGDIKIIKRLLLNLLSNAIGQTSANVITISIKLSRQLNESVQELQLQLTGISDSNNVGMAIVKQLLALHGGRIVAAEQFCCKIFFKPQRVMAL